VDKAAVLNGTGRHPGLSEARASVDWQGKYFTFLHREIKKYAQNFFTYMY